MPQRVLPAHLLLPPLTKLHFSSPLQFLPHNTCNTSEPYIRHADRQAIFKELELVNRLTMSAAVDLSSLTHASAILDNPTCCTPPYVTSSAEQTLSAQVGNADVNTNMLAAFGRFLLFLLSIIPGILVWLITFTTITLPTWLFTLFSTSLTFTMNATTLYVYSRDQISSTC